MEIRHHHPHIDPRAPRDGGVPCVNPPVFVWKPADANVKRYCLQVSASPVFDESIVDEAELTDSLYLPEQPFGPGRYFWRWGTDGNFSEAWSFDIGTSAVGFDFPPASVWLDRIPGSHPRLYLSDDDIAALRSHVAKDDAVIADLMEETERLLSEPHEMAEPEYLPDREVDYDAFIEAFQRIMWGSRMFALGGTHLALAWLITSDERFGRAACERFTSLSRWDPDGSSSINANDEAHMSIIWHGIAGIDWVWPLFADAEREVVSEHIRKRAENTFRHMHDLGTYGINRFDSHAGRQIVFLGWTLLAFHDLIPDSQKMLAWLRPVLCGVWPVWAGDDGAWTEGISYSLAYVSIMAEFAYILKYSVGIDLFRKPFWRHHADWRESCCPPYAEWIGFGDHSEPWKQTWLRTADLVELIDRETGSHGHRAYIRELRTRASGLPSREKTGKHITTLSSFASGLRNMVGGAGGDVASDRAADLHDATPGFRAPGILRTFPGAGWAAFRSDPEHAGADVAFIFRSSPYGSISHAHANNNDFILHAAGRVLLMPSGFYSGYGSPHHATWVWHTKSHNCATLSGASQLLRSHDSTGVLAGSHEDDDIAYIRGEAAASYPWCAERYDRHVLFLKALNLFVLVDFFEAKPGYQVAYEWNAHSAYPLAWDAEACRFQVRADTGAKEAAFLDGWMLNDYTSFATVRTDWDPPPTPTMSNPVYPEQYHLKYSSGMLVDEMFLPVLLVPGGGRLASVSVDRRPGMVSIRGGNREARITWDKRSISIEGIRGPAGSRIVISRDGLTFGE